MAGTSFHICPVCNFLPGPNQYWICSTDDEQRAGDFEPAIWIFGGNFLFRVRSFGSSQQFDAAQGGRANLDCPDSGFVGAAGDVDGICAHAPPVVLDEISVGAGGRRLFPGDCAVPDVLVPSARAGTRYCAVPDGITGEQHSGSAAFGMDSGSRALDESGKLALAACSGRSTGDCVRRGDVFLFAKPACRSEISE
jgi:hypothetical protein